MILPIYIYGTPVLRQPTEEITANYPDLQALIDNMLETMAHANGVGLAAPQIGRSIRLFVLDVSPYAEDYPELKDFVRVFINPTITERGGEEVPFEEGCLSLPGLSEVVRRPSEITISYTDRNWQPVTEHLTGIPARVAQHEYDHLEDVLFVDRLSPIRKRMLQSRLKNMARGRVKPQYSYRASGK